MSGPDFKLLKCYLLRWRDSHWY